MPALIETGVSNQQLLAVWSTNADTGFTIDQLLAARITLSQMYAGGIPGYILFNEVCNIPLSTGADPIIRLISTNLSPTDTRVVLEGEGSGSVRWFISGIDGSVSFEDTVPINSSQTLGSATAVFIRSGNSIVSTLSLPFDYVFSNLTVNLKNSQLSSTSIQLCPGR